MKQFTKEFLEFLKEYKVIGLAIGFVMGVASTSLVKSIVDNLVMPIVAVFVPGGAWRTATLKLGPLIIGWGPLLGELLNFAVIALVVFMFAKYILREEKVSKK
jgi:large conductance mechanosensitive channel